MEGKLNGLDLFTGSGGLTAALAPWITPIAYCENELYPTAQLLSRMSSGELPLAPIWDDIRTLRGWELRAQVDIIYGGFPCQNISVAGNGEGLDGKRSGLFFEIIRLAQEIQPEYIFLENVPNIRTKGLRTVGEELARIGYDCRWGLVSARSVGANHLRKRWFLLAYAREKGSQRQRLPCGIQSKLFGVDSRHDRGVTETMVSDTLQEGCGGQTIATEKENHQGIRKNYGWATAATFKCDWWKIEPPMGRMVDGLPSRVDRVECMGNAVVPLQARTAFEVLSGFKDPKEVWPEK